MPVSRRLRFEVLRRDGYTCRYCGAQAPDVKLTVDHVIPITLGGGDDARNLITACHDCNTGKASTSPDEHLVEDVDATALLFARAMQQASEIRRADRQRIDELLAEFDDLWNQWHYTGSYNYGQPIDRDDDWRESVERFLGHGLTVVDLSRILDEVMHNSSTRDPWRYFCWLSWREITERQELARRLIEDGDV